MERERGAVGIATCLFQSKLACNMSLPHSSPAGAVRHRATHVTETLLRPLGLFMMKRVGEILLSRHLSSFHVKQTENSLCRGSPFLPEGADRRLLIIVVLESFWETSLRS